MQNNLWFNLFKVSIQVYGKKSGDKMFYIRCNNSLSKTAVNTTCSLKSYSRNYTVMNLETFLVRKVKSMKVSLKFKISI